ncbi:hypothetical protein TRFO_20093 [Tritrichomonas foetus]|uniref:Tetraspanin family protein n=1 Tax=Tritrichomonas foetus TaxID=1144522 RepID=A0A1J4KLB8_9EUKA|nr:hypothetical protein TRFO_20093 [Tritrichomonas foetus]|eukprot:OHT10588.1 hypothetical protein TRFO_20093 [Tritrichomonas foetus]
MHDENTRMSCLLVGFFNFVWISMIAKMIKTDLIQWNLYGSNNFLDNLIDYTLPFFGVHFSIIACFSSIPYKWVKWILYFMFSISFCISICGFVGSFTLWELMVDGYEYLFEQTDIYQNKTMMIHEKLKCCGWGRPLQYRSITNCTNSNSCDQVISTFFYSKKDIIGTMFILVTLMNLYGLNIIHFIDESQFTF